MANETRRHISELLLSNRKHAKYLGILACLAVVVAFGVSMGLRQNGRAATHEEQVLDCHYAGNGAHTHDESCYDKDGNLVCPLPERELHTHTDACYDTETTLVCGLEESEGHTHDDSCYDEDGNLICGLEESEGHTHTDECYETTKTLTCGKEEITEEHVHGPGCFTTITVVEADEMPAVNLRGVLKRLDEDDVERVYMIVDVEAPEGAFPEGTTMEVEAADAKDIQDKVDEALTLQAGEELRAKQIEGVHIAFMYDGKEIDPATSVRLRISSAKIDEIEEPALVHIDEDVTQVATVKDVEPVNSDENDTTTGHENTFDLEVPLGGTYAIAEVEPVVTDDEVTAQAEGEAASNEDASDSEAVNMPEQSFKDTLANITVSVKAPEGAFPEGTTMKLSAVEDGSMDEAIKSTVDGTVTQVSAVDITFYDADGNEIQPKVAIKVTMTNSDAAEDGETMVVHIDGEGAANVVEQTMLTTSNDEVVFDADQFSVYAMVTIESKNGTVTFHGDDYTVKVTYTDEANIPKGTTLEVEEIDPASDEYLQYLSAFWMRVNAEYLENEEKRSNYNESMGDLPDIKSVNIDSARFFDITLMYDGKEIEPEVPVTVEISYDKGLKTTGNSTAVIHFGDSGTELIDDVDTTVKSNRVESFKYEQDSFSVVGIGSMTQTQNDNNANYPTIQTYGAGDMYLASQKSEGSLAKPTATKTLDYNDDGTYTLSLNVTGSGVISTYSSVTKSNVLIVMDRSSSMNDNRVYHEHTGDPQSGTQYFGKDGNDYKPLMQLNGEYYIVQTYNGTRYKKNDNGTYTAASNYSNGSEYKYGKDGDNYYELIKVGSTWYGHTRSSTKYKGKIYTGPTRLETEQQALDSMVRALLGNNKTGESITDANGQQISLDDIIDISVISFGGSAFWNDDHTSYGNQGSEVSWSRDYATIMNGINKDITTKGTNWEEAMMYAKVIADAKKADQPNEEVYVIFLTDGEPTDTYGDTGAQYYHNDDEREYCVEEACDDARKLITENGQSKYHLYSIFTYGANDKYKGYLCYLTNYAYGLTDMKYRQNSQRAQYTGDKVAGGTKDYYFDASDTSALEKAFNSIIASITNALSYGNVTILDSMTMDASTTTIVPGSATGFKYTVKGDAGTIYTVTAEDVENSNNPKVTFTVPEKGSQNGTSDTYTYTVDGHSRTKKYYKATIDGTEYKMALASYDNNGQITWDLGGIGTLNSGYTYTLSFVVWPDQDAYDYVAGLNNGLPNFTWDDNPETNPNYQDLTSTKGYAIGGVSTYPSIVKYTNGTYSVLTNTDQKLKYSVVTEETDEVTHTTEVTYGPTQTIDLVPPKPMDLTGSSLKLTKKWNDSLDTTQLAEILQKNPNYSITLRVLSDKNEYKSYVIKPTKNSDGTYTWPTQDVAIAPALITTEYPGGNRTYKTVTLNGRQYYVLNEGHTYTITEDDTDYHFEFKAIPYHPALVDGDLMNVTFTTDENGKIVDKSTATLSSESNLTTFMANNNLKSGIIIKKQVEVADGAVRADNSAFTVEVNLSKPDGTPYEAESGVGGWRYIYGPNNPDKKDPVYDDDGQLVNYGRSDRTSIVGGRFTATLYDGDSILVANLDSGVTYTVDEIDVPAGYQKSITYRMDGVEDTADTHVVKSNTDHTVTIVNKLSAVNIRIWKCGDSSNNSLQGAEFTLYGSNYGDSNAEPLKTGLISNNNGRFDLGALAGGTYYLVETKAPDGYNKLVDPVKIVVDGNQKNEADKVKYYQTGNSQADYSALDGSAAGSSAGKYWDTVNETRTCRLLVINSSGAALPSTGGMGTMPFTIIGSAIVVMAILAYGLQSRRTSGRRSM